MIILKPKGIDFPPEEHLLKSEKRNKDGIGIAYTLSSGKRKSKVVKIKKDFKNAKECYAWMKKHLKKEQAVIIHQRLGTSGLMDEGTRHPFPLTSDYEKMRKPNQECSIAFAPNGVFYGHGMHKKYSDTMLVLAKFFGGLGSLVFNNECVRELVLEFVGSSNRIAFLDSSGKIAMFGNNWIEHENKCFYSNKNYEYAPIVVKERTYYPKYGLRSYKKYKSKQQGLPYFGKPPAGKPKKMYTCSKCGKGKKSKWRGDIGDYVCAKCYKKVHSSTTSNTPALANNSIRCYYCGVQNSSYRFSIQQNACDKCYKNELWFRNKMEEINGQEKLNCGEEV